MSRSNPMHHDDLENKPPYYQEMAIQPWDVVDTWPVEQRIGAYRSAAVKYLMRMGRKDEELRELHKALACVQKLIETLEGQQ